MPSVLNDTHMRPARAQRHVLIATSISYAVVILDTAIVNVALPPIGAALATNLAGLQWVINAYTLAFACLLLSGGALGDRYGARRGYIVGLAVFTLASALCGLAPDLPVLVAARLLQGVGAALMVPCALTLLMYAYPAEGERAAAIGIWTGCGGAALAAGPLAGGILIAWLGWRSIFLVNVPICLAGMALAVRVRDDAPGAIARPLDLPGQGAAILALGALIATLIEAPVLGWTSAPVLAGWAVSVAAWASFLMIEAHSEQPMLPLALFRKGKFAGATLAAMAMTWSCFGLIFVFSLYFQQLRDYTPLRTGLAFLPLTAVVTVTNVLAGRWSRVHGTRLPVAAGLACLGVGALGLVGTRASSSYWQVGLPLLAIGVGGGLVTPAAAAALMATVDKARTGIASGVLNAARQTGSALGVALFGALIAAAPSFEAGLRNVCLLVAAVLFVTLAVWWAATRRSS